MHDIKNADKQNGRHRDNSEQAYELKKLQRSLAERIRKTEHSARYPREGETS